MLIKEQKLFSATAKGKIARFSFGDCFFLVTRRPVEGNLNLVAYFYSFLWRIPEGEGEVFLAVGRALNKILTQDFPVVAIPIGEGALIWHGSYQEFCQQRRQKTKTATKLWLDNRLAAVKVTVEGLLTLRVDKRIQLALPFGE